MKSGEKDKCKLHVLTQNYLIDITKPWENLTEVWILQLIKAIIIKWHGLWSIWWMIQLLAIDFENGIMVEIALNNNKSLPPFSFSGKDERLNCHHWLDS